MCFGVIDFSSVLWGVLWDVTDWWSWDVVGCDVGWEAGCPGLVDDPVIVQDI